DLNAGIYLHTGIYPNGGKCLDNGILDNIVSGTSRAGIFVGECVTNTWISSFFDSPRIPSIITNTDEGLHTTMLGAFTVIRTGVEMSRNRRPEAELETATIGRGKAEALPLISRGRASLSPTHQTGTICNEPPQPATAHEPALCRLQKVISGQMLIDIDIEHRRAYRARVLKRLCDPAVELPFLVGLTSTSG